MPSRIFITLNARLQPIHRGDRYEDPLQEVLDARAPGSEVTGGGTSFSRETGPTSCDVDLDIAGDPEAGLALVIGALERFGAPTGSTARIDDGEPVAFGVTEGLGLYLNGTDLPAEVYEHNDVNELIAQLLDRLGDQGELQSWWAGPEETALYLYGPSADRMRELIRDVLETHPLAERSRLVPIT